MALATSSFPRARGAFDEHGGVRAHGHLGHGLDHIRQGFALGYEKRNVFAQGLVLQFPDLLAQADGASGPLQAELQGVHAQGFDQVVEGPALHGRDDRVQILEGRDHDHRRVGRQAANPVEHLESAHVRQADVQEHHVRVQRVQVAKGFLARGTRGHDVRASKGHGQAVADGLLVVDDEQGIVHVLLRG